MVLHPTQKIVALDNHDIRIVDCGRQWGKTTLAVEEMVACAVSGNGKEIGYLASTFDQARNVAWNYLKKTSLPSLTKAPNESRLELYLRSKDGGESRITLGGYENIETYRGRQFDFLVPDEVALMRNFEYNWHAILEPTLAFRKGKALFLSTPRGFDHFHKFWLYGQKEDPVYKSWKFTSYDNPYLPKERIEQAKSTSTEDYFAQEYLADFRKFVGLVYKEFDRDKHVKDLPDFKPVFWIRGCDRGFRVPTAVPWIEVDKDGVWYQTHELYEPGLTNPPLAEKLKAMRGNINPEYSTMDSAQASDIQDLATLGEDFVPVKKESGETNQNYVRYKVEKFAERLRVKADGRTGYYVHPRCENTIREFETYRWKERKQIEASDLNELEQPEKANDHCLVGSTLVDTIDGQIKIKDLVGKGGLVNTIQGVQPFHGVRMTREKAEIVRVSFDNGKSVECTPDHLFLTTYGWVEAEFILGYDVVDIGSTELIQSQTSVPKNINLISGIQRKAVLLLREVLPKRWSAFASGGLDGRSWAYSEGLSHTSQRWKPVKQPTEQPRTGKSGGTLSQAHDAGAKGVGVEERTREGTTSGRSMAWVEDRVTMAQETRKGKLGGKGVNKEGVRIVRKRVHYPISYENQILLQSLCNQKTTRCTSVQSISRADVYNMEVRVAHCFSVSGGLIVHNCMDALADLNAMYLHEYIEIMKKPWEGKVPGTYVPPAPEVLEEGDVAWTQDKPDDWGQDV